MRKRVIVMLKYPRPGAVKTRLIPAVGKQRASEIYRSLVRHTLHELDEFARIGEVSVELRVADAPDETAARNWLGKTRLIRAQGEGDLGQRMERAVCSAFDEKAEAVVVIGTDCPGLRAGHLAWAFAVLERTHLVLGPAVDGGYYLIGVRRHYVDLFREMEWSTSAVLDQTIAKAAALGIGYEKLDPLRDVDLAEDLPVWAQSPAIRAAGLGRVSVVIPTFNEARFLPQTLAAARHEACHEMIVVDGQSSDATCAIARAAGAIVLSASRGRATQMNHGAAVATGEFLLFLHADTLLPWDYFAHLRGTLDEPAVVAGAFRFAISDHFFGRRMIEWGANWRARNRQLPFGDQGLFLRRVQFDELGGFPELPLLEDYFLVRRLQARGRIAIASAVARTSGRRWRQRGPWRTTLLNQLILLGCRLGVSPARLASWYYGGRGINPAASRPNLQASLAARSS